MSPIMIRNCIASAIVLALSACGGGGDSDSSGVNGAGSGSGANSTGGSAASAGLQLSDGDVLGGGNSVVRIDVDDDSNIVRVDSSIRRQGRLEQCSGRFADDSLTASTLLEACVSGQTGCAVSFQTFSDQIEVIPPPLYAPVGVEYDLSLLNRDGSVTDPVTAVFCFDVGVNSPPVIAEDTFQLTYPSRIERGGVQYGERCEKLVGSQGVLANDDDDEHITNSCLQAELIELPVFASNRASFASTFGADGSFVYEAFGDLPPEDSDGRTFDSFTYRVTDGVNPPSDPVRVEVVYTTDNLAPIAQNDTFNIAEDSGSQVLSVLDNDTDPDALPLTITRIDNGPGNGVATIRNGILIEYRPNENFSGQDQFTYTIEDSGGLTVTADVVINISNVNDAPFALNDAVSTNENTSIEIRVTDNDSDPEGSSVSVSSVATPQNGTAVVSGEGSVTYTPDPGFSGADSFEYTITDGSDTATATVVVMVVSVNVGPTLASDSFSIVEGQPGVFNLLGNDSDDDGDPLSIVSVTEPDNGTVEILPSNQVLYTPDAGFSGTDSFSYTVSDGTVESTAQVTVSVESTNSAPTAQDDSVSTSEDTEILIPILANDRDPDGDDLDVTITSAPSNGFAALQGGSVLYTPATGFSGIDAFDYTVTDPDGEFATATVTIIVSDSNAAPIAVDDFRSTEEDDPVAIVVLGNDSDADGDSLQVAVESAPANGTANVLNNGAIVYTPDAGFTGTDEFTYSITDPSGASDTANVIVIVSAIEPVIPVNTAPQAANDAVSTAQDTAVVVDVLANDSDADGDALTISISEAPASGTVAVQNESVLYTPASGFTGTDEFEYTVTDPSGATDTATVSISVSSVNAAPVAGDDSVSTTEDVAILVAVLDNDIDPDGDALSIDITGAPSDGTAVVQGSDVLYTPDSGFSGTDEFIYTLTDDSGETDTATVTVLVSGLDNGSNASPIAEDDTRITQQDDAVSINVLANDSDPDGDSLSLAIVRQPDIGSVMISGQGTRIIYTPATGFMGIDSFDYEVSDGNGGTAVATVTVTVSGLNAAPVAADDLAVVQQGVPAQINVLSNDTDPDADRLSVSILTPPTLGAALVLPSNQISYTSDTAGADSFVYVADDGNGATDTATVTITVIAPTSP